MFISSVSGAAEVPPKASDMVPGFCASDMNISTKPSLSFLSACLRSLSDTSSPPRLVKSAVNRSVDTVKLSSRAGAFTARAWSAAASCAGTAERLGTAAADPPTALLPLPLPAPFACAVGAGGSIGRGFAGKNIFCKVMNTMITTTDKTTASIVFLSKVLLFSVGSKLLLMVRGHSLPDDKDCISAPFWRQGWCLAPDHNDPAPVVRMRNRWEKNGRTAAIKAKSAAGI